MNYPLTATSYQLPPLNISAAKQFSQLLAVFVNDEANNGWMLISIVWLKTGSCIAMIGMEPVTLWVARTHP